MFGWWALIDLVRKEWRKGGWRRLFPVYVVVLVAVLVFVALGQPSTSLNSVANAYVSAHNGDLSAFTWTTVPSGLDAAFNITYGGQAYVCHFPVDSSGHAASGTNVACAKP
jgi:hypothetical protein